MRFDRRGPADCPHVRPLRVAATTLRAQEPQPLPRFDVASVKPSTGPTGERGQPGGYIATRAVKFFIADAFFFGTPGQMSRVIGGPEWIDSARYEINTTDQHAATRRTSGSAPRPVPDDPVAAAGALQAEDAHGTRELPVYELVLARPGGALGPQLRQATIDCDALIAAVQAGGAPPARQPNDPPPCGAMRGPARVLAGGIPMSQFANMLTLIMADANGPAGQTDVRQVIDKTGLSGRFSFTLAWTPDQIPDAAPPPGIPPIDPNGPQLVTALQEQLGLKLQPARSQMEVVVIDSIEMPTPD